MLSIFLPRIVLWLNLGIASSHLNPFFFSLSLQFSLKTPYTKNKMHIFRLPLPAVCSQRVNVLLLSCNYPVFSVKGWRTTTKNNLRCDTLDIVEHRNHQRTAPFEVPVMSDKPSVFPCRHAYIRGPSHSLVWTKKKYSQGSTPWCTTAKLPPPPTSLAKRFV